MESELKAPEKSKFKFSASKGVIELVGSENFISSHMETLTGLVRVISRHTPVETRPEKNLKEVFETKADKIETQDKEATGVTGIEVHPSIYSQIGEKLKITCKIPGSTKSEKSRNAALLYCYGAGMMGNEQVSSTELRTLCKDHGFLDSGNFSKIFDDKTIFVKDGKKGGNKQVKLTYTGREKAQELIRELEK